MTLKKPQLEPTVSKPTNLPPPPPNPAHVPNVIEQEAIRSVLLESVNERIRLWQEYGELVPFQISHLRQIRDLLK